MSFLAVSHHLCENEYSFKVQDKHHKGYLGNSEGMFNLKTEENLNIRNTGLIQFSQTFLKTSLNYLSLKIQNKVSTWISEENVQLLRKYLSYKSQQGLEQFETCGSMMILSALLAKPTLQSFLLGITSHSASTPTKITRFCDQRIISVLQATTS